MKPLLLLLVCLSFAIADGDLSDQQKAELDRLLDQLGNDDWEVRERATMALQNAIASGRPIVAYLAERMKSPDLEVRDRVRGLLLDSGQWDASPELLAEKAQAFVADCEGREIVAWYIDANVEPSPAMTEEAQRTLAVLLRNPAGIDAVLGPFEKKGEIYRRNVAWIVAADLPPGAARLLLKAGEDEDYMVRAFAAYGWGRLGDGSYLGSLQALTTDKNGIVRAAAAIAIERLPDPGDVPVLITLLGDEEPMVRYHASYSLARLTGRDGGYDAWYPAARRETAIAGWREWWEANKATWEPPKKR